MRPSAESSGVTADQSRSAETAGQLLFGATNGRPWFLAVAELVPALVHTMMALPPGALERLGRPSSDARFTDSLRLATARDEYGLGQGEPPKIREAKYASLLALDELGTEPQRYAHTVGDVVFFRHAEGRPTIITTWMTDPQLDARYGDGRRRRMREDGRAVVIQLGTSQGVLSRRVIPSERGTAATSVQAARCNRAMLAAELGPDLRSVETERLCSYNLTCIVRTWP